MIKTIKVLIIDRVHPLLIEGLMQDGFEVDYFPDINRSDLLHKIGAYQGLVVRTKTEIDEEILNKASTLRFVGRAGAGLDNIDVDVAAAKGIDVFNAGEANADAVGEQTIGMMLSLFANINKADAEVRKSVWDRQGNEGIELNGNTIGIIGFGNTGSKVAEKLIGFDVEVLAYDKYRQHFGNVNVKESSLNEIFEKSNIITLHVPLTAETHEMVNSAFIEKFKKPFWLFNMCRGMVVNYNDLMNAMITGKVLGAGLDVLANEKLNTMNEEELKWFNYFTGSSRTVLTPHIAGWTEQSFYKISAVLLKKIRQLNLIQSMS